MTNLTHIDNVEASESSSVITTWGVELANIIKVVVVEENVVNIICDEPFLETVPRHVDGVVLLAGVASPWSIRSSSVHLQTGEMEKIFLTVTWQSGKRNSKVEDSVRKLISSHLLYF